MSGLLRSVIASVLLFLLLPSLAVAQCSNDEVCLQAASAVDEPTVAKTDQITTETFTDEQTALVADITLNLKRRRLTRPAGDNAFEQIQRLQAIHPLHDYSVNGTKYIARILMVLGRSALRKGDAVLASERLQKAVQFDSKVERQAELKEGIASLNADSVGAANLNQEPEVTEPDLIEPVVTTQAAPESNKALESDQAPEPLEPTDVDPAPFTGVVTTETYTALQAQLVEEITSDLKRRRLLEPAGNSAIEKIQRLKELHPAHDYSVNGMRYVARILMLVGRKALREGDLELASRHMLKAIQIDPNVNRQDELKSAIARAARNREVERETKALAEQSTSVTTYLQSDKRLEALPEQTNDIEFVAPVMVAIPAGNFLMGSDDGADDEKPVHRVVLEAFSMSKHEITVEQYGVFALATGRLAPQYSPQESNYPVTNISWHDAVDYAEWLSQKTQKLFRLPSEAEWEYAARAGTTTRFFTGDSLNNAANCAGCGGQWAGKSVAPVGSFDPNEFGLYDTHGNVWEWVQDCWTDNYDHRTESAAAIEIDGCERQVLRGGSWYNDASYARASYRGNEKAYFRSNGVGFRVVYEGL